MPRFLYYGGIETFSAAYKPAAQGRGEPGRQKGRIHPMRLLICDRPRAEFESPGVSALFDAAFCLEDVDDAPCPGVAGDRGETADRLAASLDGAGELWIASRSFCGQVSAPVMRALELARDGRHGGGRASKRALPERSLHVWLYGVDQNAYEEQGLARMLAARLAPELGANLAECRVLDTFDLRLFKQFGSLPHKGAGGAAHIPLSPAPPAPAGTARSIALLDAGAPNDAARALLDDFEDALLAYDRLSSRALDAAKITEPPRFERLCCHDAKGAADEAPDAGPVLDALATCDTLVIGCPVQLGALPSRLVRTLQDWTAAPRLRDGMRVYAICTTNECDPGQAHLSLEVLRLFCHGNNLVWGGGLCVAGAAAVAAFARTERMGRKRRGCSEAIDRLIGAVRAGLSIADAARHFGSTDPLAPSNIINAPCALPAWAYKLMCARFTRA